MMHPIYRVAGLMVLLLLGACHGQMSHESSTMSMEGSQQLAPQNAQLTEGEKVAETPLPNQSKLFTTSPNNIRYSIDAMTALEFLAHKGEKPAEADLAQLKKESVVLFEFETHNEALLKMARFSEEKTLEYLMTKIAGDVTLKQNGQQAELTGMQFDRSVAGKSKLRVLLFYRGFNSEEAFKFHYNDQLFGAGEIVLFSA